MAPSAIIEPPTPKELFKVENAPLAYRNDTWKKPVADDYMYAFKYNFPLPTYADSKDILDFTEGGEKSREEIADRFVKQLEQVIQSRDSQAFADLFLNCGKSNVLVSSLFLTLTFLPQEYGETKCLSLGTIVPSTRRKT